MFYPSCLPSASAQMCAPRGEFGSETFAGLYPKTGSLSRRWWNRGDCRGLGWKVFLVSGRGAGGCPSISIPLSVLVLACVLVNPEMFCPGGTEAGGTLGLAEVTSGGPSPPESCPEPRDRSTPGLLRHCSVGAAPGKRGESYCKVMFEAGFLKTSACLLLLVEQTAEGEWKPVPYWFMSVACS